ncbi:hypothetical protein [Zobellella iuensis]|uniref:Uncharacterized protein n=1 Tax=Zobellella iuensis TaxID=2803811 RepID=A0ABS1QU44_9GAMM|nr:hypothetical protein [Zobellella iuensis]MBL1377759.1 hypothetical protein [Zobellella iuensis]
MNLQEVYELVMNELSTFHEPSRLVIYSEKKYHFFDKSFNLEDLNGLNISLLNAKYKIQIIEHGKFVDATKYKWLTHQGTALGKFTPLDLENTDKIRTIESLYLLNEDKSINSYFKQFFYFYFRNSLPKENSVLSLSITNHLEALIKSRLKGYDKLDFFYSYNYCMSNLIDRNNASYFPLDSSKFNNIAKDLGSRVADKKISDSVVSFFYGLYYSGQAKRENAVQCFNVAKSLAGDLYNFYGVDTGINTYLNEDEIEDEIEVHKFCNTEKYLIETKKKNNICLVLSVDERFLRIYGSQIVNYISNLREYDFHIVVICPSSSVESVYQNFFDYCCAYEKFTQTTVLDRVSFSYFPPHSSFSDIKTFYATARFFSVVKLLEEYNYVYVMDADLTIEKDPHNYLSSLTSKDLSLSFTKGLMSIFPWRKYLAGNVMFSRKSLPLAIKLCRYILAGLKLKNSWMLDQNAFEYIIDGSPNLYDIYDNYKSDKPFTQIQFRQIMERNQK